MVVLKRAGRGTRQAGVGACTAGSACILELLSAPERGVSVLPAAQALRTHEAPGPELRLRLIAKHVSLRWETTYVCDEASSHLSGAVF